MKVAILTLSLTAYAAAALFPAAPESDNSQSLLAPSGQSLLEASGSASAQCMGACQGDADGSGAHSTAAAPAATVASKGNHHMVAGTPVVEMLYSYLGLADATRAASSASAASVAAADEPVNRLAGLFGPRISAVPDANVATITPAFADAESAAVVQSYKPLFAIEWEAKPASNIVFDLDSWGIRIQSAAQRVAADVKSIVVEFMPAMSQPASADSAETPLAAGPDSAAADEDRTAEPSLTHWFR